MLVAVNFREPLFARSSVSRARNRQTSATSTSGSLPSVARVQAARAAASPKTRGRREPPRWPRTACEAPGRGDESRYNGPMPNEERLAHARPSSISGSFPSVAEKRTFRALSLVSPLTGDIFRTGTPGVVEIRDVVGCRISSFEPLSNPVRR